MLFNHYEAERMMEERVKDALREAEQERLMRATKSHERTREWWTPLALMLSSLVGLVVRPQSLGCGQAVYRRKRRGV